MDERNTILSAYTFTQALRIVFNSPIEQSGRQKKMRMAKLNSFERGRETVIMTLFSMELETKEWVIFLFFFPIKKYKIL